MALVELTAENLYKTNLIRESDTEKLYKKSIKLKHSGKDYKIIKTYFNGVNLIITMLNKNAFSKEDFEYEADLAQTAYKQHQYTLRLNTYNIDGIVIEIKNPLLRDCSFDDFNICYGNNTPNVCDYSTCNGAWPAFINDNGSVITNAKNIKFPIVIKKLRKILFNAMPKEMQEVYLKQYKDYCLTTIKNLLKEKEKLVNKRLRELQAEEKSLLSKKEKTSNALIEFETKNQDITL